MRKQDIKPGVVYAHQESRTYGEPRPVVFLSAPATSRLYVRSSRRGETGEPYFTLARDGAKAGRHTGGYPMVRLTGNDPVNDAGQFTLDDFEASTSARVGPDSVGTYTIEWNLGYILGPWDEVKASHAKQQQADQERHERDYRLAQESRKRASDVVAALSESGVTAGYLPRYGGIDEIPLPLAEAEKLVAMLRNREG